MNNQLLKHAQPLTTYSPATTTFGRRTIRSLSLALVLICSFVWYSPAVYAAVHEWDGEPTQGLESFSPLASSLKDIRDQLRNLQTSDNTGLIDSVQTRWQLWRDLKHFQSLDEAYRQSRQQQWQSASKLDNPALLERMEQSMALYQQQSATLTNLLGQFLGTDWGQGTEAETFQQALNLLTPFIERPYQSYGNDLDFIDPPPRTMLTSQAAIENLLGQSGEPDLADIAYLETDDATASSQLIQDLVNQIGTDPVTLYNWVYDHIRWLPQYGLMQSADYTLQAEQGNAFDISSLLIALLREAGYPARYVYGSVAVDPEELRNWVGDVINNDAAINLLSQGGVPQQVGTIGGAEVEMQLEHVWAQVKINGQWIDLDASLKDLTYSDGVDFQQAVPFDAESLVQQLESSSTSNDTEGWVQGVDTSLIESALTDYQTDLETYIDTQMPNATLGDVLGLSTIVPSAALTTDDISTPFTRTLARQPLQHLPDNLKYRFQLQIGAASGGSFGTPVQWAGQIAELTDTTAVLLGQNIAISFRPATQADQDLLESYLPDVITSVDDLPDSLPAGDVQMVGEITLDGEVIATTPAQPLGAILMTRLGFIGPSANSITGETWRYTENNLIVGQYQAVGIDMQGLSPNQLEALQTRLENTQQQLEAEDYTGLTKHEVTGDLLQAAVQGHLATSYAMDKIAAQAADIVYYRKPSYGTFSTQMNVSYLFGAPQSVQFAGLVMDLDRVVINTEHKDNCYDDWLAFNRSAGMRGSALEHQIPEQLFSTEDNPAEGVSTAKAFAIATAEGQKLYTLTQDNADQLTNITIDDGARNQIQQALNAGLEVTVHEAPISLNGWTGSGYTMLDPDYGVGGYMISGGESGGFIKALDIVIISLSGLFGALDALAGTLGKANPILAKITQYLAIASFVQSLLKTGIDCPSVVLEVTIFLTLAALITLLIIDLSLKLANPLAAFASGLAVDLGFSALKSATEECS